MTDRAAVALQKLRDVRESDPLLLDLLYLYLTIKLALVVVALLGNHLLPFNWELYHINLVLDIQALPDFLRPFNTWDTQHYLFLSQRGYGVNPMSNAFYPLYPYLIWAYTPLFFNRGLIAAYVIANLFSFLIPVYMYKVCSLFWTREQAFKSAVLLLAFPTAFFLSSAYAEALYLSLCLMAFYYLLKRDVLKATVLCFLLPLARAQALLFIAPMLVLFVEALFSREQGTSAGNAMSAVRAYLPPAVATVGGIGVYFLLCQWTLGDFRAGLTAQQLYVANNSLGNLLHPGAWFTNNFVTPDFSLHGYTNSLIDRAAFLLSLPILVGVYRTQNKALFVYAATTILIPALAGNFMSYTRVLLVVFPIFIYLGTRFRRIEFLAIPMFALQVLFYLLHTGGYWVA